jgi:hypothetical protein
MFALSLLTIAISAQPSQSSQPIVWYDDFLRASLLAKEQKKDLVVHFRADESLDKAFEALEVRERLQRHVCVRLPIDYVYKGEKMLERAPLAAMLRKPGLCVVSRHDETLLTHDHVVSAHPLVGSDYRWAPSLGAKEIAIILDLPPKATLSQRSMIFAITVHPDEPKSVFGSAHPSFLGHAESHSGRQAAQGVQHHANIAVVMGQLGSQVGGVGGASEVVAESWGRVVGGEHLLEACYSCVDAWHHSAGHWRAIMGQHKFFGYDIVESANGTWYATGIFAD